jgi:hypothetical protein
LLRDADIIFADLLYTLALWPINISVVIYIAGVANDWVVLRDVGLMRPGLFVLGWRGLLGLLDGLLGGAWPQDWLTEMFGSSGIKGEGDTAQRDDDVLLANDGGIGGPFCAD